MIESMFYWLGITVFSICGVTGILWGFVICINIILVKVMPELKTVKAMFFYFKNRKHFKEFLREKKDYYKWKNYCSRKCDCS